MQNFQYLFISQKPHSIIVIIKDEMRVFNTKLDNTNRGLDNSRYHAEIEFNDCFIMYSKQRNKQQHKWRTNISCQLNPYHIFFLMFAFTIKQLSDGNLSF